MIDARYEITLLDLFTSESHLEERNDPLIYRRRVFDSRISYHIIIAAFPSLTHHLKRERYFNTFRNLLWNYFDWTDQLYCRFTRDKACEDLFRHQTTSHIFVKFLIHILIDLVEERVQRRSPDRRMWMFQIDIKDVFTARLLSTKSFHSLRLVYFHNVFTHSVVNLIL